MNSLTDCHSFAGRTVLPASPDYNTLVTGFNQRFVGKPSCVRVCGTADQIRVAVQEALDKDMRITVRSGGHCYEGFVTEGNPGVILDISPLNSVYLEDGLICMEAGCTLWNVYTQLYKNYGLTIPAGSCYSVGAGGHIIGGGYGLLSRKFGLTVDYLVAVELIRVNQDRKAEILRVSRDSVGPERDLFWAHTGGGGGNFGIVTKYLFKDLPSPPPMVYLTTIAWEWGQMSRKSFEKLVTAYGDFFAKNSAPDSPYKDLFALLPLTHSSAGQIHLTAQYAGDNPDLLNEFLHAMQDGQVPHVAQRVWAGYHRAVLPPGDTVRVMPWLDATQTLNGSGVNQRGKYKSAYMIKPFPQHQIDVLWRFLKERPCPSTQALVQVDSYGCQINAVASEATAIPQRSSIMKLQHQIYWTDPGQDAACLTWMRNLYTAMYGENGPVPDGTMDGCYINYPDSDLKNWQLLYYKESYARLQHAKTWADPHNIFHHRQSIETISAH